MNHQGRETDKRDWRPFYSREAACYDASRYGTRYGRLFSDLHREIIREFLGTSTPGKALDVAAGTGHLSALLSSLGFKLTCLDLTEEMLALARQKIGQEGRNFVRASAFQLPFADGTFDIVTATRFLHLWPEGQQSLLIREMVRVLEPGGIMIIDFDNWWHRAVLWLPILFYQRVLGRGRVVEEYYSKVQRISSIIREAGIQIEDIRGAGGYTLALPLLISHRLGLAVGRLYSRKPVYHLLSEQFVIKGRKP